MSVSSLEVYIVEKIREHGFVSAPMVKETIDKSLQWLNRVLTAMVDDNKLVCLGKIEKTNYYVIPRSRMTLQDVATSLAEQKVKPTAWMGGKRDPALFLKLLEPDRQVTAKKLLDPEHPDYLDFFTQILPNIETVCYGKRASTQPEIDLAWATIGVYEERIRSLATFLRLFVENEHVRDGTFAEALSNESVNAFRSSYTREAS